VKAFVLAIIILLLTPAVSSLSSRPFWSLSATSLVDPNGNAAFLTAVTTVTPTLPSRGGPGFVSSDFNGNRDAWAAKTALRLRQCGFNAAGAWSDRSLDPFIPHTRCLSVWLTAVSDISSPDWEMDVEQVIKRSVVPDDRELIGYYTDNELNWTKLEPWADKYFEVTSRLIRKYDPNHLILGVRFNKRPPESVLRASIGRVDVHSINAYSDNPNPPVEFINSINLATGAKVIISEFSFYARVNRSGNRNSRGWGGLCDTQEQRARNFTTFARGLPPCVVGIEWFQWSDQPPEGRLKDGEDMNFGVVDLQDRPYEPLVSAVQEFTRH
jgi:hypothetical protein